MLNINQIKELRNFLARELKYYKGNEHIKLNISSDILEQILFKTHSDGCKEYLEKIFPMHLLDLSDVSFDNVDITGLNFTGSKGVKINPQKVWNKSLSAAILTGVTFDGSFDGVDIRRANFAGSHGAVINPQTVSKEWYYGRISGEYPSLEDAILTGVTFNGIFDGCYIGKTNFTGSVGAVINPQTISNKDLSYTILEDVTFTGSFDGCNIMSADFTGSKGAIINPQTVYSKYLHSTIFTDAQIVGTFDNCDITWANFTGSKGAVINPQTILNKDLFHTILEDATFNGPFDDCDIRKANFTGSHGAVINPQTVIKECRYASLRTACPTLEGTILTDTIITDSFDNCITIGTIFDGADLSQVVGQLKEQIRTQVRKRTL